MKTQRSTQEHGGSTRWTPPMSSCTRTIASTLALALPAFAQSTTLVSLDASGSTVHAVCNGVDMTSDARFVLFHTRSPDMDPTIPPLSPMPGQLWIRDLATGQNELVSVAATGGYSTSFGSAYFDVYPITRASADGRFVAFETDGSDLVPQDTNSRSDVLVRDRLTRVTHRASLAADGSQLTEHSFGSRISDDGRYVLFSTRAVAVPGVGGGSENLYRRDMSTPTTELVARYTYHADGGIAADMSADGHLVAFATLEQLLPEDTNFDFDVYVRDFTSGTLTLESAGPTGEAVGGSSPGLSADGSIVTFISSASNLVPGDTNGRGDIFVRDRATGATTLATRHSNGQPIAPGAALLIDPRLSADGKHVAFCTTATNLIDADINLDRYDVFVHDVETGETELASVSSDGEQSPHWPSSTNFLCGISADGQRVLFSSDYEFTPDDTYGANSLFLHDRTIPTPHGFCFGTAAACPCGNAGGVGFGCQASNAMYGVRLSAQGRASVANDNFMLIAGPLTPGVSALLFQGTSRVNGGFGAPFGDGLRCAGGTTTRLGVKFSDTYDFIFFGGPVGDVPLSVRGGVPATGGTFHYQVWFRNVAAWCTPATYNTSNGLTMTWIP